MNGYDGCIYMAIDVKVLVDTQKEFQIAKTVHVMLGTLDMLTLRSRKFGIMNP